MFGVHRLGTRLGVHILPVHYYSPVADILELERTRDLWARRSELPGLAMDADEQLAALRGVCLPYRDEYADNRAYREGVAGGFGPGYGFVEAQALHAAVRHLKPPRIVEVGSGVSTHCMLEAVKLNEREGGPGSALTCIEPYPSPWLKQAPVELIAQKVQAAPIEVFTRLGEGDLLFIDSSHTVKAGGDVNHLFLEVLPRLAPGVTVHIHDIYFPYDYQRGLLKTFLHAMETSLLRAYLIHNERMRVLFCLSLLHYDRREQLKELFPGYEPQEDFDGLIDPATPPLAFPPGHFPSSIYLRTC